MVVEMQDENGNVKVVATIQNATAVKGYWFIAVGNDEVGLVDVKDSGDEEVEGNTFSAVFDIEMFPAGTYEAFVLFIGTVDGEELAFEDLVEFEVTEDDEGPGKEPKPQPKEPNKPKEPAKPITPELGKEKQEQIEGGKLPKTATTYPVAVVAGLFLLIAGLALLKLRRA